MEHFERVVIPQEYPHLSTSPVDRTIIEPLHFVNVAATLELVCNPTWRSMSDQTEVSIVNYKASKILDTKLICRSHEMKWTCQ